MTDLTRERTDASPEVIADLNQIARHLRASGEVNMADVLEAAVANYLSVSPAAAQGWQMDYTEPTVGRTAWLPEAMDRALNSRAQADNVTKSEVMRRALAQYFVPEQEKGDRP